MTKAANNQTPDTTRASDVEAKSIRWAWPLEANLPHDEDEYREGRIPSGMLTTIAGRPGEGKSTVTTFFAAEVSNRKAGTRNGVLFSNMEDPVAQILRPRLESSGATLANVHFFNFFIPKDDAGIALAVDQLRGLIYALNVGLIVADPIAAHLGVSLYNDQEVRRALSPLTRMLEETDTAMIAIAHVNKHVSKKTHPLSAIGGSGGGLTGASRAVYVWGKDPKDEAIRVMAPVKVNIAEAKNSVAFEMESAEWAVGTGAGATIIRSGKLSFLSDEHPATAQQVLSGGEGGDGEEGDGAEKKAIAVEWLESYLAVGTAKATDVREDAASQGISWSTLRRAADDAGIKKNRHGFGPGSHIEWALPDGHPKLLVSQPSLEEAIAEMNDSGVAVVGEADSFDFEAAEDELAAEDSEDTTDTEGA